MRRAAPLPFRRAVALLVRRELGALFASRIAAAATIAALLFANARFLNGFFLAGRIDLGPLFELLPYLFCLFVPALAMRTFAEERAQRTFELLVTLPVSPFAATLAKFLAAFAVVLVFLAGTAPLVVLLDMLGTPDRGAIVAGYLGAALLASALLAVGVFLSALTRDQVTAFVLAALAAAALLFSGAPRVIGALDGLAPHLGAGSFLARHVSLLPPYEEFVRGLVDLPAIVRFVALSAAFLWAAAAAVREVR